LFAKKMRALGHRIDPDLVFRARREVHSLAYRVPGLDGGTNWDAIARLQVSLLGIAETFTDDLTRAELESEQNVLRVNRPLLRVIEREQASGRRVIAVSDTYFSAKQLSELILAKSGLKLDCIYSSADHRATKRSGALFDLVIQNECVSANQIIHVGDDFEADYISARTRGVDATHLVRSRLTRTLRKLDDVRLHVTSPIWVR
jgi:predicted HAD superfamily hydrolase